MALIDLTGQTFGRLTVLHRDDTKPKGHGKKVYWICQCTCGNIKSIMGDNLKRGLTTSCGCYHKELVSQTFFKDISNQTFGYLQPLYTIGQDKDRTYIWHCKCLNCGQEKDVKASHLINGKVLSCGCISTSIGAKLIEQALNELNIKYKKEYIFPDCVSTKNWELRFDYVLFNEQGLPYCAIEYQGIQHYKESNFFNDSLAERQERDAIKREYCIKHNIPLIEISYKDKMKINTNYIKELLNVRIY